MKLVASLSISLGILFPVIALADGDVVLLRIDSNPPGGELVQMNLNPRIHGTMPRVISYPRKAFIDTMDGEGCVYSASFHVRWRDGSIAKLDHINMCKGPNTTYNITIAPQTTGQVMSAPEPAQESGSVNFGQALGAVLSGYAEGNERRRAQAPVYYPPVQPMPEPPRQVQCVSKMVYGNVQTDCR